MEISQDLGAKMFMIIIDPEGDVVLKFDPALIVDALEAWAETFN
jgi:hypothetical protein